MRKKSQKKIVVKGRRGSSRGAAVWLRRGLSVFVLVSVLAALVWGVREGFRRVRLAHLLAVSSDSLHKAASVVCKEGG